MTRRLSILLIADDQKGHPDTIHDHIRMFGRYSRHDVRLFNPRGIAQSRFLDLDAFDVVVIHYSIMVVWDDYLSPALRALVGEFAGLKVQFLQDEYRFVDDVTEQMREMGIDLLYSVVPPDTVADVYGDRLPGVEILPTLTGYVPERLVGLAAPAAAERPIDVGYRGRSLAYWLGRLGFEKTEIGRGFAARTRDLGLRTDIEWTESARIYGRQWSEFMLSCRAMLASESGSSIVDYDGAVERSVRGYLAERPSAPYEEVEAEVLSRFPPTAAIKTLSPRLFEAAAMRSAMIMFPGQYSGAVEPWEHYLPLEKDFSNIAEIVERVRDPAGLDELTTRAYDHVIASGAYSERHFVEEFDGVVEARVRRERSPRARHRARALQLEQLAAGRSYHVSTLYASARAAILGYVGLKNAVRNSRLRRLLRHARRSGGAGETTTWDDLFRLAILTSVQRGAPVLSDEPFRVSAAWEEDAGRLTLTSRSGTAAGPADEPTLEAVSRAARAGTLTEIVWNHAALEQFVRLRLAPIKRGIAFDVGRYDAYGVYRFDALVDLARERPDDVVAALAPLVAAPAESAARTTTSTVTKRGSRL